MLYAASNPGHRKDAWLIDGVQWVKERNTHWSEHYSVSMEIHRLAYQNGTKTDWQLMVVIEQWWGPDRDKAIRYTSWLKVIAGKSDQILKWMKKQDITPNPELPSDRA
jgi:hypothetical protein